MSVSVDGLVEALYKDESFYGYAKLDESNKVLQIRVDETSNYSDELTSMKDEKTFDFHCRLFNGKKVSLFNCYLKGSKTGVATGNSGFHELTFYVQIYIDDYVESLDSLKLKKVTAVYPYLHPLFEGSEATLAFNVDFEFDGNKIFLETEVVKRRSGNWYSSTESKVMYVKIKCEQALPLKVIDDFFFRFSTMVSFLSNHFITYEQYIVPNGCFWFNIDSGMHRISKETGPPKINRYNYRFSGCTNEQFKEHIIQPLIHKNFKLFMHFVSTFRFKHQSIEDKFLSYYRCLESLAGYKIDGNQKYSNENLKKLLAGLENVLRNSEVFNEDDVEHVIKSTQGNNNKPAGDVIQTLITEQLGVKTVDIKGEDETLKSFIKPLKELRNALSHGRNYTISPKDIQRIIKLKDIVKELLLKEQGINNFGQDYEFEDLGATKESIEKFK